MYTNALRCIAVVSHVGEVDANTKRQFFWTQDYYFFCAYRKKHSNAQCDIKAILRHGDTK